MGNYKVSKKNYQHTLDTEKKYNQFPGKLALTFIHKFM